MASGTLTVTVRDFMGKSAVIKVKSTAADAAKALALANFVVDHCAAAVVGYGVNYDFTGDTAVDNEAYDRVLQSMSTYWFKADGTPLRFSIPAPLAADVNNRQEMDSDVAEDLKDALIAAGASASLTYNGSSLKGRAAKQGERETELTGV